jgi:anthranilate phosphoribosyltransferase
MSNPLTPPSAPLNISEAASQDWSALLQQILDRQSLTLHQASDLMQGWLSDGIPPALSGAILAAIQAKGVSATELAGMAQVLQSQSMGAKYDLAALPRP